MCEQNVPHTHKESLLQELSNTESTLQKTMNQVETFLTEAKAKEALIESKLNQLVQQEKEELTKRIKYQEEIKQYEKGQQELLLINKQLEKTQQEKEELTKITETNLKEDILETYTQHKQQYEFTRTTYQQFQIKKTKFEEQIKYQKKTEETIKEDITKLKNLQKRQQSATQLSHWITDTFQPTVTKIEKTVFSSLHKEFNDIFIHWFNHIMEDDFLSARINEEFTPTLEQNGYETEITALSGGEKTALALAYRLALNQVINEFVSELETKELLILDEPTDGFSEYQLDKLKTIFHQLHLKQLILVSHETKIEGFVQHVLKAEKNEHVSTIKS